MSWWTLDSGMRRNDGSYKYTDVQNLPDAVLTYLLPSRYCESDRFIDIGQGIVVDASP